MGAEIMEVIFEWNKNKTCLQQQYKQNLSTQPRALLISKREREKERENLCIACKFWVIQARIQPLARINQSLIC